MEDSNVTGKTINVMGGSTARGGQPRPTKDTENAGGRGRTRKAAPCRLRPTTSGAIDDEKPATKFVDHLDGSFQSESTLSIGARRTVDWNLWSSITVAWDHNHHCRGPLYLRIARGRSSWDYRNAVVRIAV